MPSTSLWPWVVCGSREVIMGAGVLVARSESTVGWGEAESGVGSAGRVGSTIASVGCNAFGAKRACQRSLAKVCLSTHDQTVLHTMLHKISMPGPTLELLEVSR